MAAQNLVLLTRVSDGTEFKVSTTKIIYFMAQSSNTLVKFVDQRGDVTTELVSESAAAIDALTGSRTQAVTLYPSLLTQYINSDRIIYIDNQTWGSRITYEINGAKGKYNQPPVFIDCTQSPSTISTAAGNTGVIVPQQGKSRYINGDRLDLIAKDPSVPADYIALYDDGKTEFARIKLDSAGNGFSIGSGWS